MGIAHSKHLTPDLTQSIIGEHVLTPSIKALNWVKVEQILQMKVDIDYIDERGRTPLVLAIEKNAPSRIIPHLISARNINYGYKNPLLTAIKHKRWDIVELLCKRKAAVDHKARFGCS